MNRDELIVELLRAEAAEDADGVERAIATASCLMYFSELAPIFSRLLCQNWHTRHEDLAGELQRIKDPESVAALEAAAHHTHEYLSHDDGFALARKCTWALADIGTEQALAALYRLAKHPNQTIAAFAQKRINRWTDEIHRKGQILIPRRWGSRLW